jgi:DNA modification methylase
MTEQKEPLAIELWPIDRPKPYPKNARTVTQRAVDAVAISLKEFGWRQPIVCDSKDVIVAGHKRLLGAQKLGLTHVPVHVARGLTPAQIKAYRLMDNRSNQNSEWDVDLLSAEMMSLQKDIDLALTGFEQAEIEKFLADTVKDGDMVLEPPAEPTSTTGDLWICGDHRVLCGDACSADVVARLLGDRKPTLMVTDPPYGIELDSEWRDRAGLNPKGMAQPSFMKKKRSEGDTETTISVDTRADWSAAFALVPTLEVAYVWHASKYTREVLDGLLKIGFVHHQQIVWVKNHAALTRTLYWFQHEPCWFVRKKDTPLNRKAEVEITAKTYWFQHEPCWFVRKKNAPWHGKTGENTTVWNAVAPKMIMGGSDEEKFDHPTQKPVLLMTRPILNHTKRGEVVYEPFLGSGTTLAGAELTGRACCGIELDPKYVDLVVTRWQLMGGGTATLDGDGRTFEEVKAARAKRAAKAAAATTRERKR